MCDFVCCKYLYTFVVVVVDVVASLCGQLYLRFGSGQCTTEMSIMMMMMMMMMMICVWQAELDRFQDTVRLLKDYYKGMDGQIPDELNPSYDRIPLIEVGHHHYFQTLRMF